MISSLGALRIADRPRWLAAIRNAMTSSGGDIPAAAAALKISMRSLYRWLRDPDLADMPRLPAGKHRRRETSP